MLRLLRWSLVKVIIGYVLGAGAFITLCFACFKLAGKDDIGWLNLVLLIFGGLLGWVIGILVTPDESQKLQFKTFGQAISTFLSGFIVAKIDRWYEKSLDTSGLPAFGVGPIFIFGSGFLLGLLFTFIGRTYGKEKTEVQAGKDRDANSDQSADTPPTLHADPPASPGPLGGQG